jgi:hypothetical protein
MRAIAAAVTPTLATIGLLLAAGPQAAANSECQAAFERWAKISAARVVPQSSNGRGACVPSEDVRTGLLDGLTLARGICADATETKSLLAINQRFIASLGVCPSSENAGAGWGAKSAPSEERPRISAPIVGPAPAAPRVAPPPPRAVPPAPPPRAAVPPPPIAEPPAPPPRPAVAAPPPAPSAAAGPPPSPPCLELSPAQNGSAALVNRRCRGHTVLAVIETPGASGETVCRGYSINYTLAVRASGASAPRINYECVAGQGPCNKGRLGDMFPECDW